jgi:predicted PilT family ATPase
VPESESSVASGVPAAGAPGAAGGAAYVRAVARFFCVVLGIDAASG